MDSDVRGVASPSPGYSSDAEKKDATRSSATTVRDSSSTAVTTTTMYATKPPPIHFNIWREKRWNILVYWFLIMFCNLALPCIIYYPIRSCTYSTSRPIARSPY